ncbi:MAG: translocation/assembly module TamB domain-containing protein [Gammaproteobacteria bacterium]
MLLRYLKRTFILFLISCSFSVFLFSTETGLKLIYQGLEKILPLHIERLEGSLLGKPKFYGLSFSWENKKLHSDFLSLELDLKAIQFEFNNLKIQDAQGLWTTKTLKGKIDNPLSKTPAVIIESMTASMQGPFNIELDIKKTHFVFNQSSGLINIIVSKINLEYKNQKHALSIAQNQWYYTGSYTAQGYLRIEKKSEITSIFIQGLSQLLPIQTQEPLSILGKARLALKAQILFASDCKAQLNLKILEGQVNLPTLGHQLSIVQAQIQNNQLFDPQSRFHIEAQVLDKHQKPLYIKGFLKILEKEIQVNIKGPETILVNNKSYLIHGKPDLLLIVKPEATQLRGVIYIPRGKIEANTQETLTQTEDIIWNKNLKSTTPSKQAFLMQIKLIIDENLEFTGHGLNAKLGGKITLSTQAKNNLLQGEGRLTIKSGKYRINGRYFHIHHGRILFPPGTLASKPTVDMRLTPKPLNEFKPGELLGLHVYGPLENPKIIPFSNAHLGQHEILNQLGFANPITVLLGNSSTDMVDNLQNKFGLDDISLETHSNSKYAQNQRKTLNFQQESQISLNKSLSKNSKLEVLSDMEGKSKAKFKYNLGKYTLLSVESGTHSSGADLMFSWEKD